GVILAERLSPDIGKRNERMKIRNSTVFRVFCDHFWGMRRIPRLFLDRLIYAMKKIGIVYGMENTFPGALVDRINSRHIQDVRAEHIHIGGIRMDQPSGYAVIVDRISHDIPFYRAYLKNAALHGTRIINNPFWWAADDKFFNYALADKIGVAVP